MLKKKIITQKGFKILTETPIVLFYHFNTLSLKNWQSIKKEMQKVGLIVNNHSLMTGFDEGSFHPGENQRFIDTLVIQNNIGPEILKILCTTPSNIINKKKSPSLPGKKNQNFQQKNFSDKLGNTKIIALENHDSLYPLFQGPTLLIGCRTKDQLSSLYFLLKKFSNLLFVGGIYNNQIVSHSNIEKIIKLNDEVKLNLIQFLSYKRKSFFSFGSGLFLQCLQLTQILKFFVERKE